MKPMAWGILVAPVVVLAITSVQAHPSPAVQPIHCDQDAIRGTYQLVTNGANVTAGRLSAAVGIFAADGAGNLLGSVTTSDNGAIFRGPFSGTYTVNSDCTGSVEIPGGSFTQGDFVIDPKGDTLHIIVTNSGAVITGVAERMNNREARRDRDR